MHIIKNTSSTTTYRYLRLVRRSQVAFLPDLLPHALPRLQALAPAPAVRAAEGLADAPDAVADERLRFA